jgi:hypothetical protein
MRGKGALLLLLLLAPRGAAGAGGEAEPALSRASTLAMDMTLYIQGVRLGSVSLTSVIGANGYRAISHLKSEGIVTLVWKETIQATASGAVGQGRLHPALYDSFAVKPDGSGEQTSLTWPAMGAPTLLVDPPYSDRVKIEVPAGDQADALDPLSALTWMIAGADAPACPRQVKVFDGRRSYVIALKPEAKTDIRMDNGLYAGPGLGCTITYRQLSGAGQEVLEAKSALPNAHVLVASLTGTGTGKRFHVPLRLWADTPFGRVAAVATAVTLDGVKLGAN